MWAVFFSAGFIEELLLGGDDRPSGPLRPSACWPMGYFRAQQYTLATLTWAIIQVASVAAIAIATARTTDRKKHHLRTVLANGEGWHNKSCSPRFGAPWYKFWELDVAWLTSPDLMVMGMEYKTSHTRLADRIDERSH